MENLVGKILRDRYRLEEQVGQGGMALVFQAHDALLNRRVAVKIMRPDLTRDPQFRERFRQEAEAAAPLSHPHLAGVYDFGEEEGLLFIVMEYLPPRTLKDLMRERGRLPVGIALEIGIQICDGLKYAHAHGIVHRDIKPQNVLFTPDGHVKITDFGIARALSAPGLTATGEVLGSVHYLSPEQARGERVTERSDVYSLGVVLYEALTGQVPFDADNPVAIALKHVQETPPPVTSLNPEVPPALAYVINKAMKKDPAARYANAQEMQAELIKVREGHSVVAPTAREGATTVMERRALSEATRVQAGPPVRTREPEPPPPSPPLISPLTWLVLFVTLAAVGLFAYYVLSHGGGGLSPRAQVEVPSVIGLREEEARQRLAQLGLGMVVSRQKPSATYPAGTVLEQEPEPGAVAREGDQVFLVVTAPPETVSVPDLTDLPLEGAQEALDRVGLQPGEIALEPSTSVRLGYVLRQSPKAGTQVARATKVDLWVASAPSTPTTREETTTIPRPDEAPEEAIQMPEETRPSRPSKAAPPRKETKVEVEARRSTEEEEQDVREIAVRVEVGSGEHHLKIIQVDSSGEQKTLHDKNHRSGDTFTIQTRGKGDTTVRVYQDGRLLEEQTR